MTKRHRYVLTATVTAVVIFGSWLSVRFLVAKTVPTRLGNREFWEMVANLSEPDGVFVANNSFRSDNLVSNERSFQQIIHDLREKVRPGAYLGVGPEQNFTYIAAFEPTIAFVIDIRRQNMLLHLLYKALIEASVDRVDFLSRLFARRPSVNLGRDSTAQALFDAFKGVPFSEELAQVNARTVIDRLERVHGFSLTQADEATIKDVYHSFYVAGPAIRFDPEGGSWIPTYAELMAQTDPQGRNYSYLSTEKTFQILKQYEVNNRIVPLVGDFAGNKTIRAVGRYLEDHHAVVAMFYTSNVETYLRGDSLTRFAANVSGLPLDEHSMFIRAGFHATSFTQVRPDFRTETVTYPIRGWVDSFTR